MDSRKHLLFSLTTLLTLLVAAAQSDEYSTLQISADTVDDHWDTALSSFYGEQLGEPVGEEALDGGEPGRRSLLWMRLVHYYISYGALSANRIPCPPRSGRSYYTHNCYRARGPVHPYTRGCSAITRCRR